MKTTLCALASISLACLEVARIGLDAVAEGILDYEGERQALLDRRQNRLDDAQAEGRSLTEDELTAEAEDAARCKELEQTIEARRAVKLEASRKFAESRQARESEQPQASGVLIPEGRIQFKRSGPLKNFKGPDADLNAYRAGQWFLANVFGVESVERILPTDARAAIASAKKWTIDNALSTTGKGAATVPDELAQTIIDLKEQYGVFARYSRREPMSTDTKNVPRRTAGLTAYFGTDNATLTASEANWDRVELVAKKLYALCKYSSEISEDTILDLADTLAGEIAYAFSNKEDECGFNGDGTSTYGGIKGLANVAAGSISTAVSGNTSFETLDLTDFEAAVGKLPHYPGMNPAWFIHKTGYWASMARLMDAAGGNTVMDIGNGPQLVFLGLPVVFSQVLNSTLGADASAIKAYVGDLSMATTMGVRRDITISVSEERYWDEDAIGIKGTQRFDIRCHELGTASAAGPVVALKTAAS